MEDELEDKLIYQTIISHVKLLTKLIMGFSINTTYFGYCWRMFRIYFLKPEVLIFSILILIFVAYLPSLDLRTKYFFKKLGLSVGEPTTFKNIQLKSRRDNSTWEYKSGNVAVYAIQGRRAHMEDRFVINENIQDTGVSLFAVFDGHGGEFAAEYAAKNLIETLKSRVIEIKEIMKGNLSRRDSFSLSKIDVSPPTVLEKLHKTEKQPKRMLSHSDDSKNTDKTIRALDHDLLKKLEKVLPITKEVLKSNDSVKVPILSSEVYLESSGIINYNKLLTDEVLATDKLLVEVAKQSMDIAGTTAIIALIEKNQLIVANVGDSRGVMCDSKGNAIPLSFDHKPQQMREKKRIQEAGGFITFNGVWRVAGVLATSRALGDYPLKDRNLVIANPDILTFDLSDHKPQFLIFASDGLWDMFTNEEAVAFIRERLHEPMFGAKSITLQAYYKGSLDNITVLVINLLNHNWTNTSSDVI